MKKLLLSIALVAMASTHSLAGYVSFYIGGAMFGNYSFQNGDNITIQLIRVEDNNPMVIPVTDKFSVNDIGTAVYNINSSIAEDGVILGEANMNFPEEEGYYYYKLLLTYTTNGESYSNLSWTTLLFDAELAKDCNEDGEEFYFDVNDFRSQISNVNVLNDIEGWTKVSTVPEPATGALALAGVALLFRRRRA